MGRALAMALALCAALPAVSEAQIGEPPVRVTAGERSAVAATTVFCAPEDGPERGVCAVAGPGAPPPGFTEDLASSGPAATPGSEVVIDTSVPSTDVRVSVSRSDDRPGGRRPLASRRIDGHRWAVSMPEANVWAGIDVDYADGASSSSFLTLQRIVATSGGLTNNSGTTAIIDVTP